MVSNKVKIVPFRRKREQKTDYKKRYHLLKGRKSRLVVRRSLQHMTLQIVEYVPSGDKVVVQAKSTELKEFGMDVVNGNIPCAYLTGILLAKKALAKGVKEAVADIGLQTPQSKTRIFAAVKGAVDGGLQIPLGADAVPSDDRLLGEHIAKNDKTAYSRYKNVGDYPKLVAQVRDKLLQTA